MRKKIILSVVVGVLLCVSLGICLISWNEKRKIENDLSNTLNAICSGDLSEDCYVYSANYVLEHNKSDSSNEDMSQDIMKKVDFEIIKINKKQDVATAKLSIQAPDAYKMLSDISLDIKDNNVDLLLEEFKTQLGGDFHTREFEVTVNLKCLGDHWYLVPNAQLGDALSGGLLEQYWMMGENTINELLEGNEND